MHVQLTRTHIDQIKPKSMGNPISVPQINVPSKSLSSNLTIRPQDHSPSTFLFLPIFTLSKIRPLGHNSPRRPGSHASQFLKNTKPNYPVTQAINASSFLITPNRGSSSKPLNVVSVRGI